MGGRDNARAGGPGAAATSGKAAAAEHNGNNEGRQAIAPAAGHLGDLLRAGKRKTGLGLGNLTVLSPQNDLFRIDTPSFHQAGRWFAAQLERENLPDLSGKHLRGIHYALLGSTVLPSGEPYANTAEHWEWVQDVAAKAARWLGYVPFDAIIDQRNAAPIVRRCCARGVARGSGRSSMAARTSI